MNGCAGLPNEQGSILAKQQQAQAKSGVARGRQHSSDSRPAGAKRPHRSRSTPSCCRSGRVAGWLPSPHASKKAARISKIGVVARKARGRGQTRAASARPARRSVATFASAEDVGTLTYAAACELGATEANQQVVLGDGAEWIKTQAHEHFPDAVKVLDWPHLWRHPCALLSARSIRANAPPNAPGAKSSMRCCFRGSGRVSANTHWHIFKACAPSQVKCLPYGRRPSGISRPKKAGWATTSCGKLLAIQWGAAWWNVRSPS
jgi:hypothetical protein